ncbi:Alternative cytochrome c oxidase subunit 2 [Planctomycetes bacterium Pan216]|uniref:Cytochrome c oxidase subunit 2 n=1 Tax=Kolteria novifilia TaxID=2527975 RepID=A0A518B7Z4_9BACT|nr:Alternative cytochrome c oxidase subunit 2 [Planctomycetes bacterium Pan216]
MSKWAYFFLAVPILVVAIFGASLLFPSLGWGLPENVSTIGKSIDFLYYAILAITGVVFVGTQLALCWLLFIEKGQASKDGRGKYTHGNHRAEVIWTVVPAFVLGIIAFAQMPAWYQARFNGPRVDPIARVVARQFEWRIVYPGPDGQYDTSDDIHVPNELHVPVNRRVRIELRTMDVLHSFFLPHLRVKHDAVPGLSVPVWFDATKTTREYQNENAELSNADFRAVDGTTRLGRICVAIDEAKTPLTSFLKDHLSAETRAMLASYLVTWNATLGAEFEPAVPSGLRSAMIGELNGILATEDLSDPKLTEGINLTASTTSHLASPLGGRKSTLLNREILQDAFPGEIKPLERHFDLACAELCGWGHYKMKGRLIVHETQEELDAWLAERHAEQEASR